MIENITLIADNEAANVDSINTRFEKANSNFNDLNLTKADLTYVDTKLTEINISLYEQKTYAELKMLKENNQLKTGQKYLLTDYVTTYQQPVSLTMKVGKYDLDTATPTQIQEETEPLLLEAISNNEFAIECYSPMFPDDVIYYDFDDNLCEDGTTPRNGFILRRYWVKNEVNVPNDWRHMKWARFKVDTTNIPVWVTNMSVEKGKYYIVGDNIVKCTGDGTPSDTTDNSYFKCVVVKDYINNYFLTDNAYGLTADMSKKKEFGTFSDINGNIIFNAIHVNIGGSYAVGGLLKEKVLHNNVFIAKDTSKYFYGISTNNNFLYNTFADICCVLSFGNQAIRNHLGGSDNNITIEEDCYSNVFGANCSSISLNTGCNNNILGDNCSMNFLGTSVNGNIFGASCYWNTLSTKCYDNIFGSGCQCNSLNAQCNSNRFGAENDNNVLFCSSFNIFGDNFKRLFIKNLTSKNVSQIPEISSDFRTTTIEKMSGGQYCYWYRTGVNPTDIVINQIP